MKTHFERYTDTVHARYWDAVCGTRVSNFKYLTKDPNFVNCKKCEKFKIKSKNKT